MKYFSDYKFIVGLISVLSGLLAMTCIVVGAMAVEFNFDAFSDPVLTLQYAHNYGLAKWFNLLDLFGYYLLLLPLVFYFHQQYKHKSPWMPLLTFSGASYVLTGALGAAILAALWPEQMKDYLMGENTSIIVPLFKTTTLLVTKGIWNILEVLFAAVWWIGLGKLLFYDHKIIGVLTIITGISTLFDAVGNILDIPLLSDLGMNSYLLLGILWPSILGIFLVRKSVRHQSFATERQMNTISSNNF